MSQQLILMFVNPLKTVYLFVLPPSNRWPLLCMEEPVEERHETDCGHCPAPQCTEGIGVVAGGGRSSCGELFHFADPMVEIVNESRFSNDAAESLVDGVPSSPIPPRLIQTEKMAALGQLVSGIAHELNNPLTSIRGYAQLLLTRKTRGECLADAEHIYQEAERASQIVRNLLQFARESHTERKPLSMNEVIERTLQLRNYELAIENINLSLDLDAGLPQVLGNSQQMQQVLLNLIVNAEQAILQVAPHRSGPGQIRIRTFAITRPPTRTQANAGIMVGVEISDNGPGVEPDVAPRVFDPFFTTKPPEIGTGLGLSIVYGIVHEHGGEIYLVGADLAPEAAFLKAGERLGGATFVIELPALQPGKDSITKQSTLFSLGESTGASGEAPAEMSAMNAQAMARVHGAVQTDTSANRSTISHVANLLVIEDEATVAHLVRDILEEEGYDVDILLDLQPELDRISHSTYDLILCDLRMAKLDGRAFYDFLARSESPLIHHVAFITGDTLSKSSLAFLEETGVPCLAKPFLVEDLKRFVRQALKRSRTGDSAPSSVAGTGELPAGYKAQKKSNPPAVFPSPGSGEGKLE